TAHKAPLTPGVRAMLGGKYAAEPVKLPKDAIAPDNRSFVLEEERAARYDAVLKAEQALKIAETALAVQSKVGAAPRAWFENAIHTLELKKQQDSRDLAALDLKRAEAKHLAWVSTLRLEQLSAGAKKDAPEWKQLAFEVTKDQRSAADAEARYALRVAELVRRDAKDKSKIDAAEVKLVAARKALA